MSKWKEGIPKYDKSDIMTESELLDFAMHIVNDYEICENGYQLIAANNQVDAVPNFVAKKGNDLCFIIVRASIAPIMPKLTDLEKKQYVYHASKFNAKCYFAPVSFGSTDPERFTARLALRDDGFYTNYVGMEEL